jgi:hypothetical protein
MFSVGEKQMGCLRGKILFGLIAYFGGFATAIYYLAPVSQDAGGGKQKQLVQWKWPAKMSLNTEKSKEEAGQFKQRVCSAVAFAEEQAGRIVELYKAQAAAAKEKQGLRASTE